jgi:two-component system cell cycle sensor histidine kinase/response regulator CckA
MTVRQRLPWAALALAALGLQAAALALPGTPPRAVPLAWTIAGIAAVVGSGHAARAEATRSWRLLLAASLILVVTSLLLLAAGSALSPAALLPVALTAAAFALGALLTSLPRGLLWSYSFVLDAVPVTLASVGAAVVIHPPQDELDVGGLVAASLVFGLVALVAAQTVTVRGALLGRAVGGGLALAAAGGIAWAAVSSPSTPTQGGPLDSFVTAGLLLVGFGAYRRAGRTGIGKHDGPIASVNGWRTVPALAALVGLVAAGAFAGESHDGLILWLALASAVSFGVRILLSGMETGRLLAELGRSERQTRLRARRQQAISALGEEALAGALPQVLMQKACEVVADALDVALVKVLELAPARDELTLRAGIGWQDGLVGKASITADPDSQAGYTLLTRRPVIVHDLARETRFSGTPLLHEHRVVSGLTTTIGLNGSPFGVLGAHSTHARAFDDEDVGFLTAVANLIAQSVRRCDAEAKQRASEGASRASAEERRAAELRYKHLVEDLPLAVYIDELDPVGHSVYMSPQIEALSGYSPLDWLQESGLFGRILHPDDRDRVFATHREAGRQGGLHVEYRLIAKDGRVVWVEDSGRVLSGGQGEPTQIQGFMLDVTDRRRAEDEHRKLAAVVECSPSLVGISTVDGQVSLLNGSGRTLLGLPRSHSGEISWRELVAPDCRPLFDAIVETTIGRGEPWHGEIRLRHLRTGEEIAVDVTAAAIPGEGPGPPQRFSVICRDIRERKSLESRLQQAHKLEAVGRLAGGIAHDFNNLLQVIGGYGESLEQKIADEEQEGELAEIRAATDRASALTHQLIAFSKGLTLELTVLDVNDVVRAMEQMLGRVLGDDLEVSIDLEPELWPVRADAGQLEQVVANLALNARDAMPEGGRLSIRTQNVKLNGDAASLDLEPGQYVRLSVTDTGIGMDDATVARAFEPFFTMKDEASGSGLGLAMVHGIVAQSGGTVRIESEPGRGATVVVHLPRVEAMVAERPAAPERIAATTGGTERILVVEDDPAVRRLCVKVLELLGYHVTEADRGSTAIEAVTTAEEPFDIIVTDFVMPGMTGRQLVDHLVTLGASPPTLFMSGYAPGSDADALGTGDSAAFLQKPFASAELARRVRGLLDAAQEAA